LWYDVQGSTDAEEHRAEVLEFANLVAEEVLFRSESYQCLFERLRFVVSGTAYEAYLQSRYFSQV
jgi:hypothetical protein